MSLFEALPEELLLHVFEQLDPKTLGAVAETCTVGKRLTSDNALWKALAHRDFLTQPEKLPEELSEATIADNTIRQRRRRSLMRIHIPGDPPEQNQPEPTELHGVQFEASTTTTSLDWKRLYITHSKIRRYYLHRLRDKQRISRYESRCIALESRMLLEDIGDLPLACFRLFNSWSMSAMHVLLLCLASALVLCKVDGFFFTEWPWYIVLFPVWVLSGLIAAALAPIYYLTMYRGVLETSHFDFFNQGWLVVEVGAIWRNESSYLCRAVRLHLYMALIVLFWLVFPLTVVAKVDFDAIEQWWVACLPCILSQLCVVVYLLLSLPARGRDEQLSLAMLVLCLMTSSILLVLSADGVIRSLTIWDAFIPLWVGDGVFLFGKGVSTAGDRIGLLFVPVVLEFTVCMKVSQRLPFWWVGAGPMVVVLALAALFAVPSAIAVFAPSNYPPLRNRFR